MFSISFLVSVGVAFATVIIFFPSTNAMDDAIVFSENEKNLVDSEHVFNFIARSNWGGLPPKNRQELQHPVDLVIVAHTVTSFCLDFSVCSKIVKSIQQYHLSIDMPDIAYNFLIGGDGNIYEGRGWDSVNYQKNQSISVSFVGNYLYDYLSVDMIDALQDLLSEGVKLEKLNSDYKVVCHNQTRATLSPGTNVYEVIKTFSHYYPGKLD